MREEMIDEPCMLAKPSVGSFVCKNRCLGDKIGLMG